jgi:dTDP-4-amino-4,6-dideoxygalactose transaminase
MSVRVARGHPNGAAINVPFVDLSAQTQAVKDGVLGDIERLLDEGAFVNGPAVAAFETAFAEACGMQACVGVASGLDALRLALLAAGIEPGDEVIVPAMTFVATFEAVVQAGGVPVPADVRDDDVGVDVGAVEAACTARTRFVMPVHLYGQPVDLVALGAVASARGLAVIEDACQAHGAERDGIQAGTAGLAGAFSFYPSKNLGAMGDAGALVTNDAALAARVRALRQHGESRRYYSDAAGYTARLDAIQALVLRHKLPHLEGWNEARIEAAAAYSDALDSVGDLRLPVTAARTKHVWHLYTVRTADPQRLADHLATRGIGTGRHYPEAPHLSGAFAYLGYPEGVFPVAESIARETLSLPLFPGITEEQQKAVVSAVHDFFSRG